MKIFIKNMVCQGTRKFVLAEIRKLGLKLKSFETGEIEFSRELTAEETGKVIVSLKKYGLEAVPAKNGNSVFHTISNQDHMVLVEELAERPSAEYELSQITVR